MDRVRVLYRDSMSGLYESGRMTGDDLNRFYGLLLGDSEISDYLIVDSDEKRFEGFYFGGSRKACHEVRDDFVDRVGTTIARRRRDSGSMFSQPVGKTLAHGKCLGLNYALVGAVTETGEERYMMTIHPYRRGQSRGVLER